jgi:hypothetical protein
MAVHSGLRALLIAGTCLTALQYPLLAAVHGVGVGLLALCVVTSLGDTFYWSSYHAYFAALGSHEHRGSEVGAREAIAALVGIVSPLVTGWALFTLGPAVAFGATALILLSAALPLLWTPNIVVPRHVPHAIRGAIPGMQLFLADGWIAAGYHFVWQIALFLSLRQSYVAYGGALALSALVGAAAGLLLGRHIDAGHGRSAVVYALGVLVLTTIMRAASAGPRPTRHHRQRARRFGRLPLHPDADDGSVQPGEAFRLHAQVPRSDGRCLGCWRGKRMPGGGASCCGRRFLVGRHSPLAARRGGAILPPAALLREPPGGDGRRARSARAKRYRQSRRGSG